MDSGEPRALQKSGLAQTARGWREDDPFGDHFANNTNIWGIGTFCVTVDYQVPVSVGEDKLRAFCEDARAGGATVQMWGNTAISTLNLLFDNRVADTGRIGFLPREDSIMEELDRKDSFVRNPSNAIEADHYTPEFAVLNLRDSRVRDYWLRRWKAAHDEIGLGAIFLDSSCNLSNDKFHYVQTHRPSSSPPRRTRRILSVFFDPGRNRLHNPLAIPRAS